MRGRLLILFLGMILSPTAGIAAQPTALPTEVMIVRLFLSGAGHAFLLRQCVAETPGFKLVEAEDYLP